MAIAPTVLTSGIDPTDATSYTTASIDTSAHYNELITVAVYSVWGGSGQPNTPTLTTARGLSITSLVTSGVTADFARLTLFRTCIASGGSSGTLVIDFAGQTQTICAWAVTSWTGTRATAANNGSDAIGVSAGLNSGANATSITQTLAALQTGSATYSAFSHAANEGSTVAAGYTSLSSNANSPPASSLKTEWKLVGSTTIGGSWTTTIHPRIVVGCEILQAFAASGGVSAAAASLSATDHEGFELSGGPSLAAAAFAATSTEAFKASGGFGAASASIAAVGHARHVATGAMAAAAAGLDGTGSERFTASGEIAAAAPSFDASGNVANPLAITGTGDLAAAAAILDATGGNIAPGSFGGSAAFAAAPAAFDAAGTVTEPVDHTGTAAFVAAPATLNGTGLVFGAIVFPSGGVGGAAPAPRGRPVEELKPFPPPEPEPEPVPLAITGAAQIAARAPRIGARAYNEPPPRLLAYAALRLPGPVLGGEGSQDLRPAVETLTRQLDDAVLLSLLL